MNFDYDVLRNTMTNELYNQYKMQLDSLKEKNERNIMKKFKYKKSYIEDIYEEHGKIVVFVELIVSFIDYIERNGKKIRGKKRKRITHCYSMWFVKKIEKNSKCPNCGAPMNNTKCNYCGSIIPESNNKWLLSKKQSIWQK